MNRTKIEYVDYTWNPVSGCLNSCTYCYARRIANRFKGWTDSDGDTHYDVILKTESSIRELTKPLHIAPKEMLGKWPKAPFPYGFIPTFHKYRLGEPQRIKKPSKIFVCSMADLFGDWVPVEWIKTVYEACQKADWHQYLFLTKNPIRYSVIYRWSDDFRINMWFGATATNEDSLIWRTKDLYHNTGLGMRYRARRFLSIEPLLGQIGERALHQCIHHFDWVIIGQQTGPGAVPPKDEWVDSIIMQAQEARVPVFVKSPLYHRFPIQQWPEGLK